MWKEGRVGVKTGKDGGKSRRELEAENRQEGRRSRACGVAREGATTRQCPRVPKHIPHPCPHYRKSG